jgi:hypothetical protein
MRNTFDTPMQVWGCLRVTRSFSRRRAQFVVVFVVMLTILGLALGVGILAWQHGDWPRALLLWLGSAAICTMLIGSAPGLLASGPGLQLRPDGFLDDSGALPSGFVPWSDVQGVRFATGPNNQGHLVFFVREPEVYARRGSVWTRWLRRGNASVLGSPVWVSVSMLAAPRDEVFEAVLEYVKQYTDIEV